MTEPFDAEYVRPAEPDCPECDCCTKRLCEAGRVDVFGCLGRVADPEIRDRVRECPCSAETTPGTEAYRAAQVRAAKRADLAARVQSVADADEARADRADLDGDR